MVMSRLSDVSPKHIHPHLAVLSSSCHFKHHCATLLSSMLMQFCIFFSSCGENEYTTLRSSAYRRGLPTQKLSQISLINTKKSKGPKTLPCITPLLTGTALDNEELILTIWYRLLRKESSQASKGF
ncbi:unnamed protein product [Schistosoma mattheei]|uniref:Uncharacterized protein n=2 Tax=Schistosoma mattheei TaxID=31246 RepID=A0AA85BR30_9TREM|nr:unnamed protein product [Schistosoma mattheei]